MIIHTCAKIFDKNSAINNESKYLLKLLLDTLIEYLTLFLQPKTQMPMQFFFFNFVNISNFKIKFPCKIFINLTFAR